MKKIAKLLGSAAFILALIVSVSACGSNAADDAKGEVEKEAVETTPAARYRTLDEIKDDGTVKIGVFADKSPFGSVDETGKYVGYDIELATRIAEDLGVSLEYIPLDPASRVEFASSGKADIILANFTVTAERKLSVDFASPYQQVTLGVITPNAAPITSEAELAGKKIIVIKGTTAESYFEENLPQVELIKFESYTEAKQALLDGRGDGFANDNTEVLALAKEAPDFAVTIDQVGPADTIAPAVAKGNSTLLAWLNSEIKTLNSEKFFTAAYAKTLADIYGPDPSTIVIED